MQCPGCEQRGICVTWSLCYLESALDGEGTDLRKDLSVSSAQECQSLAQRCQCGSEHR